MQKLKFSTELQNADISPVTLLKSDCTIIHQREKILPAISKTLRTLQGNIFVVQLVFSKAIGGWIGQLEHLDCRPAILGKLGKKR